MTGNRRVPLLVVLVALVAVAATPSAVALATPPPPPAAYYGSLTVNGEPATAGVTITATIDGEVRGSLTTEQSGAYGGPGAFDGKLQVNGTDADDGKTVTFFVGGVRANATVSWQSGDVRRVDLGVTGDVAIPGDGGSGIGGGGGSGAGGGGSGAGGDQQLPPDESDDDSTDGRADVTVERSTTRTSVAVSNASANETVRVDFSVDDDNESTGSVSLDGLDITTVGGDFTLEVTQSEDPPPDAPGFDVTASEAVGYIQIDHSIPDENIQEVAFRFRASRVQLDDRGIDPGDVVLYRYHDGVWTPLETTVVGETASHYAFRTVSPGLSVFAIGTRQRTADIQVSDARLSATEIAVGDRVTVNATVENRGDGDGEITVALFVDSHRHDAKSVWVPPGETRTVSFQPQFDEPGEYAIRADDVDAGQLRVTRITTTTTTMTASATETPATVTATATEATAPDGRTPEESGRSLPHLVSVASLLAAVVAGAYYLVVRRS